MALVIMLPTLALYSALLTLYFARQGSLLLTACMHRMFVEQAVADCVLCEQFCMRARRPFCFYKERTRNWLYALTALIRTCATVVVIAASVVLVCMYM
jgi:hypothetical protein